MIESEWEFKEKVAELQHEATLANWCCRHGQAELKGVLVGVDKIVKECLEYLGKHNEITDV